MGNIPSDRNALFAFAQAHAPVWSDNAASIGLTPAQALAVKTAVTSTIDKAAAADEARSNSKNATRSLSDSYGDLRRAVADAMRTINTFALNATNPTTIYSKAQIAPPQNPSNLPPPTAPFDLAVTLDPSSGALNLRWKASQPSGISGVVYTLRRRIGPTGAFMQIALTGEKRFVDFSIPAGSSQIAYNLQAQRGSQTSPLSNTIEVRFGSSGMAVSQYASTDEGENFKMAA